MKINLTKLLGYSNRVSSPFVNNNATDAAYLLPPWYVIQDQTAQTSPYSFTIEQEEDRHD